LNDFQRYLTEEFAEDYTEGRITRREALKLIASVTGSLLLANTILAACAPPEQIQSTQPATAEKAAEDTVTPDSTAISTSSTTQAAEPASPTPTMVSVRVSADDPALQAGMTEFPTSDGAAMLKGYLARPVEVGAYPVILVCHENRGLTEHIQDVTRRLAKAGYTALAVDLLSRQGGSAGLSSSEVPGILGQTAPDQFVQDFLSGWQFLQGQPYAQTERVGMTGFCFGGGVTWRVAVQMPELKAAVPYYGPHPAVEDVPKINAAVLAIYGELDQRINQGIPAIEAAMQAN
jgi:carboxymethylenebutenolidase